MNGEKFLKEIDQKAEFIANLLDQNITPENYILELGRLIADYIVIYQAVMINQLHVFVNTNARYDELPTDVTEWTIFSDDDNFNMNHYKDFITDNLPPYEKDEQDIGCDKCHERRESWTK